MTDQKIIDYLDQFCVKDGDIEVKAIDVRNGICSLVVPVFNGENEFTPHQIATLDFEFDFDGEDVTIYKFPKRLFSEEDRFFIEEEISDAFSLAAEEREFLASNESKLKDVMDKDFEALKKELFLHGQEAIEDFLGYEIDPAEGKEVTDNRMDEVYMQMPEKEAQLFFWAYGSGMKAVNIQWDIDDEDVDLPTEVDLPKGMVDVEKISDYLSDVTGFCHGGFRLVPIENKKPSLTDQIQSAETRAASHQPNYTEPMKAFER